MDINQNTAYFQEVLLDPPDDPKRLVFVMAKGAGPEPDELRALRAKLDQTARAVAIFFKHDQQTRRDFMHQLHKVADAGCRGAEHSVVFGESGLENVRQEVVDLAEEKKNEFHRRYLHAMLTIAVPGVMLGGAFIVMGPLLWPAKLSGAIENPEIVQSILVSLFLIPAGSAFGVWLEFALRTGRLDFDRLLFFDTERWHLSSRMAITIGLAAAFAFLLAIQAIQVGMFNVLLNDFVHGKPWLGFAIGLVAGLGFPIVRDYVQQARPVEKPTQSPAQKG